MLKYSDDCDGNEFENILVKMYEALKHINESIVSHGSKIPIRYLMNKLIRDNYELVFTGYNFGAALAAFLAIRLLIDKNLNDEHLLNDEDKKKRISFVGFNCPLFLNKTFQIIEQHQEKFHFYRSEKDLMVNFCNFTVLDVLVLLIEIRERYKQFGMTFKIESNKPKKDEADLIVEIKKHIFQSNCGLNDRIKTQNLLHEYFSKISKTENKHQHKLLHINLDDELKHFSYEGFYKNRDTFCKNENLMSQDSLYTINRVPLFKTEDLLWLIINLNPYGGHYIPGLSLDGNNVRPSKQRVGFAQNFIFKLPKNNQSNLTLKIRSSYKPIPVSNVQTINFEVNNKKKPIYQLPFENLCQSALILIDLCQLNPVNKVDLNELKEILGMIDNLIQKMLKDPHRLEKLLKQNLKNYDQRIFFDSKQNSAKVIWEKYGLSDLEELKESDFKNIVSSDFSCRPLIESLELVESNEENLKESESNQNNSEKSKPTQKYSKEFIRDFFLLKVYELKLSMLKWSYKKLNEKSNDSQANSREVSDRELWHLIIDILSDLYNKNADIVNQLDLKNDALFYLNIIERRAHETFDSFECHKSKNPHDVRCNQRIREMLVSNQLVGVVGLKQAGKSKFVELIANPESELSESKNTISQTLVYPVDIGDIRFLLIEYPAHNFTDETNKIMFRQSIHILDYVFIICDAMNIGEKNLTTDFLRLVVDLRNLSANRFCVLANKFDELLDEIQSSQHVNELVKNYKERISECLFGTEKVQLKPNSEYLFEIIPCCLDSEFVGDNRSKFQKLGILYGISLEKKIREIILNYGKINKNESDNKGKIDTKFENIKSEPSIGKFQEQNHVVVGKPTLQNEHNNPILNHVDSAKTNETRDLSKKKNNLQNAPMPEDNLQKLLTAWRASIAVNTDDPIKELENSELNHGINTIIKSQTLDQETNTQNIITRHIICDFSNQDKTKKRLVVAVAINEPLSNNRDSNFIVDFYESIVNRETTASTIYESKEIGFVNKSVVDHSSRIPIDYFEDKLNDDYDVVFTGYSFGAALAAFLAIRLIIRFDKNMDKSEESKTKNISFIGFGCPLFAGEEFQKFINKNYGDQFHFYTHELDRNLEFFNENTKILFHLIDQKQTDENKREINSLLANLSKFNRSYLANNEDFKKLEKHKGILHYHYKIFGILELPETKKEVKLDLTRYLNKSQFDDNPWFKQPLNKLKEIKQINELNIPEKWNFKEYNDFMNTFAKKFKIDETMIKEATYTLLGVKMQNENELLIGMNSPNLNTLVRITITLKMKNAETKDKLVPNRINYDENIVWFRFTCPKNRLDFDNFKQANIQFQTHYMNKCVNIETNTIERIHFYSSEKDKRIKINQLPIDLLYLHASFFLYLMIKSINQQPKNESKNFLEKITCTWNNYGYALVLNKLFDHIFNKFNNLYDFKKFFKDETKEKEFNEGMQKRFDYKSEPNAEKERENPILDRLILKLLPEIYSCKLNQIKSLPKDLGLDESELMAVIKLVHNDPKESIWHYKVDVEADLIYERELRKLIYEGEIPNVFPNVEGLEKTCLRKKFFSNERNDLLEIIKLNYIIRESLIECPLVGVIGLKKSGKSSFVDLFCETKVSSSIVETEEMSAYPIINSDSLLLIDYPHYNSTDEFYKVQFKHSKYMLDCVFVIVETEQIGKTSTRDLEVLLGDLLDFGLHRICVIANKFDKFLEDLNGEEDVKTLIEKVKNTIFKCLMKVAEKKGQSLDSDSLKILTTCMNIKKANNFQNLMSSGILFGNILKKEILKTISSHMYDQTLKEQLDNYINLEQYKAVIKEKKCKFFCQKGKTTSIFDVCLSNDEREEESWNKLLNDFKDNFSITNEFVIKTKNGDFIIENFEKFFTIENVEFEIIVTKPVIEKKYKFFYQKPKVKAPIIIELDLNENSNSWPELLETIKDGFSITNEFVIKTRNVDSVSFIEDLKTFFAIDNIEFEIFIKPIIKTCKFFYKGRNKDVTLIFNEEANQRESNEIGLSKVTNMGNLRDILEKDFLLKSDFVITLKLDKSRLINNFSDFFQIECNEFDIQINHKNNNLMMFFAIFIIIISILIPIFISILHYYQ